mgnify:CR=1 FL=1
MTSAQSIVALRFVMHSMTYEVLTLVLKLGWWNKLEPARSIYEIDVIRG